MSTEVKKKSMHVHMHTMQCSEKIKQREVRACQFDSLSVVNAIEMMTMMMTRELDYLTWNVEHT